MKTSVLSGCWSGSQCTWHVSLDSSSSCELQSMDPLCIKVYHDFRLLMPLPIELEQKAEVDPPLFASSAIILVWKYLVHSVSQGCKHTEFSQPYMHKIRICIYLGCSYSGNTVRRWVILWFPVCILGTWGDLRRLWNFVSRSPTKAKQEPLRNLPCVTRTNGGGVPSDQEIWPGVDDGNVLDSWNWWFTASKHSPTARVEEKKFIINSLDYNLNSEVDPHQSTKPNRSHKASSSSKHPKSQFSPAIMHKKIILKKTSQSSSHPPNSWES